MNHPDYEDPQEHFTRLRKSVLRALVLEFIVAILLLVCVWAAFYVFFASVLVFVLFGIGVRHCKTDEDVTENACCCAPMTALSVLYYLHILAVFVGVLTCTGCAFAARSMEGSTSRVAYGFVTTAAVLSGILSLIAMIAVQTVRTLLVFVQIELPVLGNPPSVLNLDGHVIGDPPTLEEQQEAAQRGERLPPLGTPIFISVGPPSDGDDIFNDNDEDGDEGGGRNHRPHRPPTPSTGDVIAGSDQAYLYYTAAPGGGGEGAEVGRGKGFEKPPMTEVAAFYYPAHVPGKGYTNSQTNRREGEAEASDTAAAAEGRGVSGITTSVEPPAESPSAEKRDDVRRANAQKESEEKRSAAATTTSSGDVSSSLPHNSPGRSSLSSLPVSRIEKEKETAVQEEREEEVGLDEVHVTPPPRDSREKTLDDEV